MTDTKFFVTDIIPKLLITSKTVINFQELCLNSSLSMSICQSKFSTFYYGTKNVGYGPSGEISQKMNFCNLLERIFFIINIFLNS